MKTFKIVFILLLSLCFSASALAVKSSYTLSNGDIVEYLGDASCPVPRAHYELSCHSYYQTTNYTCGPSAIMTLMHFYGKLTSAQMNKQTELQIAAEMGASKEGTTPYQVTSWLSDHGFSVDSGVNIDTDTLINNLKKGIPTLISVNRHWILAKGYNLMDSPDDDEILFSDSCCGTTSLTRKMIDSMWLEAEMPSNRCDENVGTYIVATPSH